MSSPLQIEQLEEARADCLGNALLPVSYQEMEDAVTGRVEKRKVAKPEGV